MGRVHGRDVFRGPVAGGDLQGGRGVGVGVPGRGVLGLVTSSLVSRHVQHPDHRVGPRRHQALLPVRVGRHVADAEARLKSARHVEVELVPLVDDVVVVRRLVVVPGAVVVLSDVVSVLVLRAVGPSHSLPVDVLHDVLVSLGLVGLVVLCNGIINVCTTPDLATHHTHLCISAEPCPCLCWRTGTTCCAS